MFAKAALTCFLVSLMASTAAAQPRPASFETNEENRKLYDLIKFPEIKGDVEIELNCFAQVLTTGKLKNPGCYVNDQFDQPFAKAVQDAGKKARMLPASIDGKKHNVFFQFRVDFTQKVVDEEVTQEIVLYPNNGVPENVEEYGDDYVGAQRVIGNEGWMKICPKHARYFVYARAHIDMDGTASSISLEHGGGIVPTGVCQQAIIDTIAASPFTPTMLGGEPVPSSFIEPFSN